jgi:hypothetical protein
MAKKKEKRKKQKKMFLKQTKIINKGIESFLQKRSIYYSVNHLYK